MTVASFRCPRARSRIAGAHRAQADPEVGVVVHRVELDAPW